MTWLAFKRDLVFEDDGTRLTAHHPDYTWTCWMEGPNRQAALLMLMRTQFASGELTRPASQDTHLRPRGTTVSQRQAPTSAGHL